MRDAEVDQSGKTGDRKVVTVLALANDVQHTLVIPAKVKRVAVRWLRARGKSNTHVAVRIFTAGLFLLLKRHLDSFDRVMIDVEYVGWEAAIKAMLLERLRQVEPGFQGDRIVFRHVGKKSPAHRLAIEVYRHRRSFDRSVTEAELLDELRK